MLRFLIQNGANPKTEDSIGRSALHYAASSINVDAAGDCIILVAIFCYNFILNFFILYLTMIIVFAVT